MTRAEWLKWRQGGIGASDAPIIMGVSEFKTPYDLYLDKIADNPIETSNFISDKGVRFESKIRALYESLVNKDFPPALCQTEQYPMIRASLDGRSADKKEIIEIKLSGKEDWERAKRGIVPKKYYPQVQHQLFASGADVCYFLSYIDDDKEMMLLENLAIVVVCPDQMYIEDLMRTELHFWHLNVLPRIPPPLTLCDFKALKGVTKEFNKWLALKRRLADIESEIYRLRNTVVAAADAAGQTRLKIGKTKFTKENGEWFIEP